MSSDEDDDLPLGARMFNMNNPTTSLNSNESGSPLPDWIVEHKSPYKQKSPLEDSDDEDPADVVTDGSAPTQTQVDLDASQQAGACQPSEPIELTQAGSNKVPLKLEGSARKQKAGKPFEVAPGLALGLPAEAIAGEVPVMLSEKLTDVRMLVELEPAEDGATDLAGDSGAVGRIMVADTDGHRDLRLDLKGVLYNATIVEAGSTLCILHIGPSEARVEAIFSEYATLREEVPLSGAANTNQDMAFLLGDDEDDSATQIPGEGDGAEGSKAKAAVGGGGGKAAKALKGAGKSKAGVSKAKKPAKPKAGGKAKSNAARQKKPKK